MDNKQVLEIANAAISSGDYEGFLAYCTEDTEWNFLGDQILRGKQAVREYMASVYLEPPKFHVERMIAEGDFVTALGEITLDNVDYSYCDVWRFRDGKLHELRAYVVAGR